MWVTKQLLVTIDFHRMEKNTMEVTHMEVTHILQNIFYVREKKETLTGLEHRLNVRIFISGWTMPSMAVGTHSYHSRWKGSTTMNLVPYPAPDTDGQLEGFIWILQQLMKMMVVVLKLVAKNQAAYYIAHCVAQEVMRVEWQTLGIKSEKEWLQLKTVLSNHCL